jgi:hypothetical protein
VGVPGFEALLSAGDVIVVPDRELSLELEIQDIRGPGSSLENTATLRRALPRIARGAVHLRVTVVRRMVRPGSGWRRRLRHSENLAGAVPHLDRVVATARQDHLGTLDGIAGVRAYTCSTA